MIKPFPISDEDWRLFVQASYALPECKDERDNVLSICKAIAIVHHHNESELFESLHKFAINYPDYRLLTDIDRGYVLRAYAEAFDGIEGDLIDHALQTITDSPAMYLPPAGYAYSISEPLHVARHEYRQSATRIAAAINPSLKLVDDG